MGQTPIVIHLDEAVKAQLAALAQDRQQPLSDLAAEAIASFVDLERWQEQHIRHGLADIEAGRSVGNERVMEWLQSWGTESELPPPK